MARYLAIIGVVIILALVYLSFKNQEITKNSAQLSSNLEETKKLLDQTKIELDELKNQDQIKINQQLKEEIANIEKTYSESIAVYEDLLDLKDRGVKTAKLDALFAAAINKLAKKDFVSSGKELKDLAGQIAAEKSKLVVAAAPIQNVAPSNSPPSSGYSRQKVQTDAGEFVVDIVSGDMNSTRVIVDTASDNTCTNDCPVLSLGDYVSRSGAYAGVNGSYFCPASYPSCAGKTNSFDTLAMNKNKIYFNSDNNVYSTLPAVIFMNGSIRFVGQSLEWGRDTGVDSVLANQPLLISGGNIIFGGSDDAKQGSKGARSFVANKGSVAYIGVVHSATVAESARALKALGMDGALNLDDGGSTALWSGGYKVGPGRNIPNAILFVKK